MSYSTKFKLASICEVRSGYTARNRLDPVTEGGVRAIQLRDLEGEKDYDPAKAPLYLLGASSERYWVGPGDVMFRSRGERNTAVVVAPHSNASAVAILPLVVLHPNRDLVDPRYLAWAMNQPPAQRYFDKCALGTNIRMIPKAALDELEVELPDLKTQKLITELDALARRERDLARKLADRKFELAGLALLKHTQQQRRTTLPSGNCD